MSLALYPRPVLRGLLALSVLGVGVAPAMDGPERWLERPPARRAIASPGLDSFPMTFEANRGQGAPGASFLGRGRGWSVALRSGSAEFGAGGGTVTMRLRGARETAALEGVEPVPTRSNYFLGNDPSRWLVRVPHFAGLRAAEVLPGVAMRWRGVEGRRARYDFECAPGADPASIVLAFEGADAVTVAGDGSLEVRSGAGVLRHSRPVAWQTRGSSRLPVRCEFRVRGGEVGFDLGPIDPALPLVIDPTVEFEDALGGGERTEIHACGVDALGGVVVAGSTTEDLSATTGAFQTTLSSFDAFVARYQPGSASIDWLTYLGGEEAGELCLCLDIGDDGFIYLGGATGSGDFPLKDEFQALNGFTDGFVTKLAGTGDSIDYSTCLGSSGEDSVEGIAVDSDGKAWVCGWTRGTDFPLLHAVDSTTSDAYEGFVTCFNADGDGILSSTFLGGSSSEYLNDIALAPDGTVWFVGETSSTNLPTASPVQANKGGTPNNDAVIAALSSDGKTLVFSSYLGGTGGERAYGVDVDANGDPVIVGHTGSGDFPKVSALDSVLGNGSGGIDGFVCRLDGSAKTIEFSTYLGGNAEDYAYAVALDPDGGILVVGKTKSGDFPSVDPIDDEYVGQDKEDWFISKISGDGSTVLFSTHYGDTDNEEARAVATDGSIAVVAGKTTNASTNGVDGQVVCLRFRPDPLRNLRAEQVTGSAVDLAWDDSSDGELDVELQRATGAGEFATIAELDAGSTTHEDSAVSELLVYRYRVRGVSESGDTPWSTILSVTIPPRAAEDLAASVLEDGSVSLEWTDTSSVETGFLVLRRIGSSGAFGQVASLPAGSESWNDTSVLTDFTYQYRVRTLAAGGAQADSATTAVMMPPRAPGSFAVQALDDVSVALSWQDLSTVETGYEIQRRDDGAGGSFATSTTTGPGATLRLEAGLSSENAYTWRVRALGAVSNSSWSAEVSLVTPPVPPSNVTVETVDPETVRVRWTDGSSGESAFRVESRRDGVPAFTTAAMAGADASEALVSGLIQKQEFEFRVRAVGSSGASRAIETVALVLPAQIVIESAKRIAASGTRPARLSVSGRFDTGPAGLELPAAAELRVGDVSFDLSGVPGPRGSTRYEQDGLRLDLTPARSGSSAVSLRLTVEGDAADAVDPEGEVVLFLGLGEFEGLGSATLQGGAFSATKGVGSRTTPSMTLRSFKAKLGVAGRHSFAVKGAFRPYDAVPGAAPSVRVEIGGHFSITLDGAEFTERKGKFVLKAKGPPDWNVTVDPLKGTLALKGARLNIGEFPPGAAPVRLVLVVGDRRFEDEPVLVATESALSY